MNKLSDKEIGLTLRAIEDDLKEGRLDMPPIDTYLKEARKEIARDKYRDMPLDVDIIVVWSDGQKYEWEVSEFMAYHFMRDVMTREYAEKIIDAEIEKEAQEQK